MLSQGAWRGEGVPLFFILIAILFTGFGIAYVLLEQRFKQRELSRLASKPFDARLCLAEDARPRN